MADITKKISVIIQTSTVGAAQATKRVTALFNQLRQSRLLGGLERSIEGVTHQSKEMASQMGGITHGLTIQKEALQSGKGMIGRFSMGYRRATENMGRFHMELLSVMFAGMALQRAMGGLLQPAMQASGIFELWSAILTILFLPIVMSMMPFLTDLLKFVTELSPEVKWAIGLFVVFGLALGTALFVAGQLGLAIAGLNIFVHGLAGGFTAAGIGSGFMSGQMALVGPQAAATGTAASAGLMPIIIVIGLIIGAVLLLNEMWKSNFGGIRQHVGNFLIWFSGIYDDWVKPVLDFIGKGVIFLVNLIDFSMRNAGAIMERIWLQIYASTATVWNWIIEAVEFGVNAVLSPIKMMWDTISWIAGMFGVEMGKFPTLDLSDWKVELTDVEKRVAELDEQLGVSFADTLRKTQEQAADWTEGLNNLTGAIEDTGKEMIKQGEAIDMGMKGEGFLGGFGISDLLGGIIAPETPISPVPIAGGGQTNIINYSPEVNIEKAIGDEALRELVDDRVEAGRDEVITILEGMGGRTD